MSSPARRSPGLELPGSSPVLTCLKRQPQLSETATMVAVSLPTRRGKRGAMSRNAEDTLRGARVERIDHVDNEVRVTVASGDTVTFSTETQGGECLLTATVGQGLAPAGFEMMTDTEG